MRTTALCLAISLWIACTHSTIESTPERDGLTPRELYAEGERYDGKFITVRGFIVSGRCLYPSKESLQDGDFYSER